MMKYRRSLAALLAALAALFCFAMGAAAQEAYDMSAPDRLAEDHLYAESALLVDEDSGETLFSKNSRVRMYPASTTKIMTLLLGLESDIPLDSQVTIPREAADIPEGSSVVPVKPGDVMRFSDLLYGFMLSSGNDGANAVAVLVDGSIEAFVDRMNARAAEIGCEGTHYVNAHGYHDANHYTTARDLALISRVAMANADFRKIVAAPRWTMTIQRGDSTVNTEIVSRNTLLQSNEKYYYPDCTGIKTGHHNKAGWCFVGSAERDGKRVICVVLNCAEEMSKWYDAARLFEYGFTRYEPVALSDLLERSRERFASLQIEDAAADDPEGGALRLELSEIEGGGETVPVVRDSDTALGAAMRRISDAVRVSWDREPVAPVEAGERMGTLTLELADGRQVTAALTASRAVARQPEATPTPAPAVTEPPEEAAHATTPPAKRGAGTAAIIAGLAVLLALAFVLLAVLKRGNRRRRRRRRHGKRYAQKGSSRQESGKGHRRSTDSRRPTR